MSQHRLLLVYTVDSIEHAHLTASCTVCTEITTTYTFQQRIDIKLEAESTNFYRQLVCSPKACKVRLAVNAGKLP